MESIYIYIHHRVSGIPQMPPSVPLDPCSGLVPGGAELGDPHQLRGAERSRGGGQSPGGGGGAIRNMLSTFGHLFCVCVS